MASAAPANGAAALPMASRPASGNASSSALNPGTAATSGSKSKQGSANGSALRPKSQAESKAGGARSAETTTPDKHAHDRLVFLVANFVGSTTNVTVKSGDVFMGVFSGASLESSDLQIVLKMTRKVVAAGSGQHNGATDDDIEYIGSGKDHVMVFDLKDIVDIYAPNISTDKAVKMVNGASSSFRTDTEISGNQIRGERQLQQWEPAGMATGADMGLNGSVGVPWNQFETNERLYGVKTDYDEKFYTTSIDRSDPAYQEKFAAAEAIARRIENSSTTNAHIAEERGVADDGTEGLDEEERYSGVRRDNIDAQSSRFTATARQAQNSKAATPGPLTDPAIISSQIARPEQSPQSHITDAAGPSETPVEKSSGSAAANKKAAPTDSKKAVLPASGLSKPANEQKEIDRPIAKPTMPAPPATAARQRLNATETVEKDVLGAFKTFAAGEKQKTQERRNQSARVEKEVKLNELKKFAAMFKLKSEVPPDMLGILAKTKDKQVEIMEKSKQSVKEQAALEQQQAAQKLSRQQSLETSPTKRAVSAASNDVPASIPRAPNSARVESSSGVSAAGSDRRGLREGQQQGHGAAGGRQSNRQFPGQYMPPNNARIPGNLGKNLMAIQNQRRDFPQHMPVQDPRMLAGSDAMMRASVGPGPLPSQPNRLNVEAMEFRPNPAASSFTPGAAPSTRTSSSARKLSQASTVTESIFSNKTRPTAEGKKDQKTLKNFFNPIKRLRKSAEEEKKQEFASNGGIPQAYRTPPTWHVSKENEEKSYRSMFEQSASSRQSASPANTSTLNEQSGSYHNNGQGHHIAPAMSAQSSRQHHPHHMSGREPSHEDHHRMHHSSSNSSVLPSPRFNQQPMMPQNGHMYPLPMPQYGQPMPQTYIGPGGQPMFMRPMPGAQYTPQGMPMAPPMMQSPSVGGMMNVPMPAGMPMYAQSPSQVYAHPGAPPAGGPGAFYSPRPQMMVPHGSQQGQQPHMVFVPQPNQPMFAQQPQAQMHPSMRGGIPMQPQGSYGSSPRMQNHYPQQNRAMPPPSQYQPAQVQQGNGNGNGGIAPSHQSHGSEEMK